MRDKRIDMLSDFIFRLSEEVKLSIVNEYNECMGNRKIYLNNEDGLEELAGSLSMDAIFRAISYGDYRYLDKFVKSNEYGNFVSMDYLDVDLTDVAEWMIEHPTNGNAHDAWVILNASSVVESGEYIYDIEDEFGYVFDINDYDNLHKWIEDECDDKTLFDWMQTSWYELYEDYLRWAQEQDELFEKTMKRCEN